MYLTASRPDIQFSICLCARYQANPKESHLVAVKRICMYLKAEAEYVAAAGCCAQVLWIKSQLVDYDILYDKVPIFYDNTSAIAISNNPVLLCRQNILTSAYYSKLLWEFRYTVEADTASKSITFTLLHFYKPLSFDLDTFSSVIGIDHSDEFVNIPPKETVKAGLATLGLVDEDHPSLSSYDLIKWSSVKVNYFSPTWKVQGNQPKTADAAKVTVFKFKGHCTRPKCCRGRDVGVHYLEEPTFEQLMDEVDNQNKAAQEQPESPYDTESEIKFVKSFKYSLSTHLEDEEHDDANITFIGSEPVNKDSVDYGFDLHFMPSDDMISLTDPFGHLRRELTTIFSKVDQLESCITKHVFEELKSSVPSLVSDALKETLHGLLVDALQVSLPSMIQESVQNTVYEYMREQTSVFQAQVHQTLEEQLASLIYKPMNKQFNAFNKIESQRFVHLEKELSKCIKSKLSKFFREKENTKTALVFHQSEKEKSDTKDETSSKKLIVLIPTSKMPKPTPLSTIIPEHLINHLEQKLSVEQFTDQLFSTTSFSFIPSPLEIHPKAKKLADLKAEKEEFEKALIKLINLATVKDQTWKLAEYKEKKAKMLDEYNKCIYERVDPLPITKMHYKAKKLGLSPPPELVHFGKPVEDMKRKRTEILQEVFVKENIVVDEIHRNLIPPPGIVGSRGQVIKEPESGIFFYNGNFNLVFQREEEFHLATTAQLIKQQSAIQRGTPKAEEMIKKLELTMEARDDVIQARKIIQDNLDGLCQDIEQHQTYSNQRHRQKSQRLLEDTLVSWDGYQLRSADSNSCSDKFACKLDSLIKFTCSKVGIEGLAECIASASNLTRIQVTDVVKEVEDQTKTYSSAGMDISDPDPSSTQSIPLLGAIIFTNIQVYALAGGLGFGCRGLWCW
nr:retrovirus-related Pol polyprotein from transposon TNT 1-94 [Tanacetum cinerariifolium]